MKLSPFNSPRIKSTKGYLLYAFGEVFLIVIGILLAMYLNNLNQDYQYKNKIDENINRVFKELEKNLSKTGDVIHTLMRKDSLINLYMSDSLEKGDYLENMELAVLVINANNLRLEDEAYHNLIQLNTSGNRYKDELIADLTGLYKLHQKVDLLNEKMSDFVVKMLVENVDSYGDLAYKGSVDESLIDYCLTSKEYKLHVTQYAVLSIRNQLKRYQNLYALGRGIYKQIAKQYDWRNEYDKYSNQRILAKLIGSYGDSSATKSLHIKAENDSIFLSVPNNPRLHLVPYAENRLFLDNGQLGYFVSFYPDDQSDWTMSIHILSNRGSYKKLE